MDTDNRYEMIELQKNLLELLKAFHTFCVSKDIKYSLDWGSLLGAVRHHGFIPWDDDVDIMVDRKNYDKIRKLLGGNLLCEHGTPEALWIDRIRLDKDSEDKYRPTIDVFIIDNAPDGSMSRKLQVLVIHILQGMLKNKPNVKKGNVCYIVATIVTYLMGRCFPRKTMIGWYQTISQRSNKKQTEMKACYNDDFYDVQKLYRNNILSEFITVPFEDTEVCVTKEYHQTLVDKYGPNYMTLPPESDRKPKHV